MVENKLGLQSIVKLFMPQKYEQITEVYKINSTK